ncbi:MAG: SCO family protein [Rhodopila sp.]|nr:SCO family protein [Rhodopila sp.]
MMRLALLLMLLWFPCADAATDLSSFAYDQHPGAQLPLRTLFKDGSGRVLSLGQALANRPTILALGYFHCPNLCGLVRNDLMNALGRLDAPANYSLVVLSIDPSETPADARSAQEADAARFEPAAGGHYLTGSAEAVRSVTDAVGLRARFDAEDRQFLHPAGLVFLTSTGAVSGYLLGLGYQPSDIGLNITRAASGVAERALPILLLCFHYDPTTGRYTLAILRVVQLGAAITVMVVAGIVMLALHRERRSQ